MTSVDQPDVNRGNDVVSVTVGGEQADLQITKTVDRLVVNVGDQVTFVATLRNNGPSAATAITVSDEVTAGLRIDEATPSQGSFDTVTRTWNAGNLAAASEATLTMTATVLAPDPRPTRQRSRAPERPTRTSPTTALSHP